MSNKINLACGTAHSLICVSIPKSCGLFWSERVITDRVMCSHDKYDQYDYCTLQPPFERTPTTRRHRYQWLSLIETEENITEFICQVRNKQQVAGYQKRHAVAHQNAARVNNIVNL